MSHADPLDTIPQALRDAMLDPERRDQDLVLNGTDVRVRFDPEPGVAQRVHLAEGARGMTMTSYEAATERPPSYPPHLPHLPGLKASVHGRGDTPDATTSVTWWSVPDMERALAELRAQSAAAGWVEAESSAPAIVPGMRMIDFRHPDGRRRLAQITEIGTNSMIALYDNARD